MTEEQKYIDFEAYERVAEPHKRERVSAWRTAIGLQYVDGLRVSDYLKNRYMLIGYKDDENDTHTSTHTSTRTSTHTSSIDIQPSSENVTRLVLAIGKEEMSVKNMMEAVGLKNRPNFMDYSLTPAIREGFVCMKYPANPHHPRQRYLLTVKGLMLLDGNNG